MSNINLSQSPESSLKASGGILDKSLGISIGLLILAFGAYFGLLFYGKTLDSNLASINASIETEKKKIASDQANRVVDFQDRLDVIGKSLKSNMPPSDNLAKIEASMLPETRLSEYSYDMEKQAIQTTVIAESFKNIAEQIVAFKKVFSNVSVGDTSRSEDGKLKVDMTLSL